jgi:EF-hand domain pair
MKMIGSIQGNMPSINPQEMFKKMDKNGDGGIDESEFAEMAKGKGRDPSKIMTRLDTNKDGKVDATEMEAGRPNRAGKAQDPSQLSKTSSGLAGYLDLRA